MTVRRVWLGSTGPFLYDDAILYNDEDGVISPDNQQAIATDGQIIVQLPPTSSVHVVRKAELDNLHAILGLGTMAYQNSDAVNITGGSAALTIATVNSLLGFYAANNPTDGAVAFFSAMNAGGTNRWAFYAGGTAPSYFGGPIQFADPAAIRNNLLLGTMAVQNANAVNITGGSLGNIATFHGSLVGCGSLPVAGFSLVTGADPAYIGGRMGFKVNPPLYEVDVNGYMRVGTSTPSFGARVYVGYLKASEQGLILKQVDNDTGPGNAIAFVNAANVPVGTIATTASATAYNTTSDARLKHAVESIRDALDVVQCLRPVSFLWNADNSRGNGFLAHEVEEVVPEAITGKADAVDEEGDIIPQMIDASKLVPWLTAAMQELLQQVKDLTARVAELEAA